jgi:hypothetical protein
MTGSSHNTAIAIHFMYKKKNYMVGDTTPHRPHHHYEVHLENRQEFTQFKKSI